MRSLFGSLNIQDADRLNQQIDQLYADQKQVIHLENQLAHLLKQDMQDLKNMSAKLSIIYD